MLSRLNQLPQRTRPPSPSRGAPCGARSPAGRGALPSTHQVKSLPLIQSSRLAEPGACGCRPLGPAGEAASLGAPRSPAPGTPRRAGSRRRRRLCGRWGLGTGNGSALSLSPASLSHLCWADSFCGKSLTVKALGPDDPSADDSLATPRESKEQQEKGRFFFFFPPWDCFGISGSCIFPYKF